MEGGKGGKNAPSGQGTLGASRSSPRENSGKCSPLPLRICLSADLYARVYLPDLTTCPQIRRIRYGGFKLTARGFGGR
ncbi:hypothetical protein B0H10DRAFT_2116213 [Mycena sp. CBHHK59/15]|nr:hypothetical protein B0H10DRAFT_2116213 [Mycena sp. CBHHK59/15]